MTIPVVIFKWLGTLPELPEDKPEHLSDDENEQMTYELAYPVAVGLVKVLRKTGVQCDDPYAGTLGWDCTVRYANRKVPLFINWTAIEYPPHNYIAIQWHISSTWSELLPWKRAPTHLERDVKQLLDRTLRAMPEVGDIQWLTDEQFGDSYCRGKPLPEVGKASNQNASEK